MPYTPVPMSPLDVKAEVERLQRSWMASYTREAHEVSGLWVWVVFYLNDAGEVARMSGQFCGVNLQDNTIGVTKNSGRSQAPLDRVLEVHIKPTA